MIRIHISARGQPGVSATASRRLTHTERPPVTHTGVTFACIPTAERILAEAQAAAGGKAVRIAGGARTARELLSTGLVDEIQLHLVPRLLGDGLRLCEQLSPPALERTRVLESPGVTHLQFRVLKS